MKKVIYEKKTGGHRPFKRVKLLAKLTQPVPSLYLVYICSLVRALEKDAQKQWAGMSLSMAGATKLLIKRKLQP